MIPALGFWVHNLDPFLIRFTDRIGIRYYGLAYAAGFLIAAWLLDRYARAGRSRLPASKIGDFMVAAVLGVVLGGRVGWYLLYDGWRTLGSDPFAILRVWDGGMSFHGGLLGVIVAVTWYARIEKISIRHLWDIVCTVAPAGLLLGRLANFWNGELWGRISVVPWAVIFPRSMPAGTPLSHIPPRHPSQLYEAAMEGVLLLTVMQLRFWKTDVVRAHPGRLSGEFLVCYALLRIAGETFREPDASLVFGLSRGTFYSLFMIAGGLYLIVRRTPALDAPGPQEPGA